MTRHQELSSTHIFSHAPGLSGSGFWQAESIVVDSSGNSYVLGDFSDNSSLSFGCTGSLSNPQYSQRDIFLVKFDDDGDCVWQISLGDNASSQITESTSYTAADLSITPNDTVVVALNQYFIPFGPGDYARTMGFFEYDGSANLVWSDVFTAFADTNKNVVAIASGDDDVYVLRWGPRSGSSRTQSWAESFGGLGSNQPADVAIDQDNGDIAIVGNYDDEHTDLDSNAGNSTDTNAIFIQTLESDGTPITSLTSNMASGEYGVATATAFDTDSELYLAGYFEGEIIRNSGLAPTFFTSSLTSNVQDGLLIRYDSASLSSVSISGHSNDSSTREEILGISAPFNNVVVVSGETCSVVECVPSGFTHEFTGSYTKPTSYLIEYSSENYRFNDVFSTYGSSFLIYVVGQARGINIDLGGDVLTGGHDLVAAYEITPDDD
ncbi:hypothetical protein FRD01_18965 [Microvenator marinus]|uniref:Uncharacterized protein n=1 Tax=Microvenator marinus TaxID=2600177 RepID=A0A5B8XVR5_9DELT|nr:hypothetical protein [Microvenator marinus]QED29277.1 hypothetical protein FRD01_18965 [Microvenator marinus]